MAQPCKPLLLLLLLLVLNISRRSLSLDSDVRVCNSLLFTQNYDPPLNASQLQRHWQTQANGCQYVYGDVKLEIIGINRTTEELLPSSDDISSDFLDSIEEISGRLIILRVSMPRLTLKNLKVIRGYNPKAEAGFYSIDIAQAMYPMRLELPRLVSVTHSSVLLTGAIHYRTYCHLTRSVDWQSLFTQGQQQQFLDTVTHIMNEDGEMVEKTAASVQEMCEDEQQCHPSCSNSSSSSSSSSSKQFCWSNYDTGCQRRSACSSQCASNICYSDDGGTQKCCHTSCLGGCSGTGPEHCDACKHVSYAGECKQSCLKREGYDPGSGTLISQSGMLRVGDVCVKKCPHSLVKDSHGMYCLSECPANQIPENGICIPCSANGSQTCIRCKVEKTMVKVDTYKKYVNCTVLSPQQGSVAFYRTYGWSPAMAEMLRNIRVIQGKLTLAYFTNLSFVRNLQYVRNRLSIHTCTLRYIPLKNLQFTQELMLFKLKGLCAAWFPRELLNGSRPAAKVTIRDISFDTSSSECASAACDPQCLGECWGPGPDLCVACRGVSVDGVCFGSCREANRFAENDTQTGRTVCRRCHPECVGGCRGPSATDCVRCRHFSQDAECVSRCSRQLRPDELGVCHLPTSSAFLAIGVGTAAAACVLLLLLLLSCIHYTRRIRKYEMVDLDEFLTDPNDPNDMAQLLMVNDDDVMKQTEIGSGAFGTVFKGKLRTSTVRGVKELPVAIKVLRGKNPKLGQELLNEASVLARVKHPNCIRLVALCLTEDVQLITALMPRGSLLEFVKSSRNRIGAKRILDWALQVAEGMAYLESVGIVHRDLAARNVLLQTQDSVKITDFGLARLLNISEQEYLQAGGLGEKLPVKWLSVECFESGQFSHKSDVWSYGVLLWEVCTFGESPYNRFTVKTVDEILTILRKGIRLHQPDICSIDFYNVMLSCWLPHPESRPRFCDLTGTMQEFLSTPSKYIANRAAAAAESAFGDLEMAVSPQEAANDYVCDPVRSPRAAATGDNVQLISRTLLEKENEADGYMVPTSPVGRVNPAGPQ